MHPLPSADYQGIHVNNTKSQQMTRLRYCWGGRLGKHCLTAEGEKSNIHLNFHDLFCNNFQKVRDNKEFGQIPLASVGKTERLQWRKFSQPLLLVLRKQLREETARWRCWHNSEDFGSWPDVGRPVADVCNGIGGKAAGWSSSSPGTRRGVRSQSLAWAALACCWPRTTSCRR